MTGSEIVSLKCMESFVSPRSGMTLTVCRRHYGQVPDELMPSVLDQTLTPEYVVGSSDGRGYFSEWHSGEESGESVYVEKWSIGGCQFHGFVDSVSRKIVQSG